MRRILLGAASVLALGIAGAALDYSADAGDTAPNANLPPASQISQPLPVVTDLSKDDIRWAQLELRNRGLYKGSLDGILGPETKRALARFQRSDGLKETATLDQHTMDALTGNAGIGQGSSMPPNSGAGPVTNSSGGNDFGDRALPK